MCMEHGDESIVTCDWVVGRNPNNCMRANTIASYPGLLSFLNVRANKKLLLARMLKKVRRSGYEARQTLHTFIEMGITI